MRALQFFFCTIGALLLWTIPSKAQENQGPQSYNPVVTGAPILSITPDARSAAMGEIGLTTSADAFALFHNTSKLAQIEKTWGVAFGYTPWMAQRVKDISLSSLTGYYHWGNLGYINHAVGASVRYFHIGEAKAFQQNLFTPITIVPYEVAVDLGYAIALNSHWSLGVNMKYLRSDYNFSVEQTKGQVNRLLGDLSATYQTTFRLSDEADAAFRSAIVLNNIGAPMSYDGGATYLYAPTTLRLGVGMEVHLQQEHQIGLHLETNKVLAPTLTDHDRKNRELYNALGMWKAIAQSFGDAPGGASEEFKEVIWAVGAEYSYDNRLFLRSGYHYQHKSKGTNSGFSIGAGLVYNHINVDIAYFLATQSNSPLNNTFRLTLGVNF